MTQAICSKSCLDGAPIRDQASVLVQIGALDPKLYPTAGVETAKKAFDENLPSNTLMARWKVSAKETVAS